MRGFPALVLSIAAVAGSACFTVPEARESALQERIGGSEMSPAELRTRVRALAGRFSGELEGLADELAAKTQTLPARLAFTRLKVDAVSQMQMALFQPDPVAALVDAWALLAQMQQAIAGLAARGDLAPPMVATAAARLDGMEAELGRLWGALTGTEDIAAVQASIDAWSAAHPIQSLATRESTVGLLAQLTTRGGVGALGAASFLLEDTQDLARRMDLLAAWAPRQARWQAEIFLRETLADPTLIPAVEDPQALLDAMARVLRSAEEIPAIVAAERAALLEAVDRERRAVQAFVTAERVALVEVARLEREAVIADGTGIVDHAFDRATVLADRVLLRLLLILVVALIAVAVALIATRGARGGRLAVRRRGEVP